jgi:hypothetical protein
MSLRDRYKEAKEKRDSGEFIALPYSVLNGAAYLGLNAYARMLLLDLAAQYQGNNNGDLCAAWKVMKPRGWKSEATLDKAKKKLLKSLLIVETRKGAFPNKCSLFALTWHALDECHGKLDISPRSFPRGAYKQKDLPSVIVSIGRIKRIA